MRNAISLRLIALTDRETYPNSLEEAEKLCEQARPGTVAVVLRDRKSPIRERLASAEWLRRVTHEHEQLLFVSDRVDLARVVGADGVHLPAAGMSPSGCRSIWRGLISRSGHHVERLGPHDWAALDGMLVSPVAAPRKGRAALGILGFQAARENIKRTSPEVWVGALGGIDGENAGDYLVYGADGVAVVGGAWNRSRREALLEVLAITRN